MRALGPGFVAATVLAAAGFLIVPGLILAAPLEPVMGFVQKIFYFHVPCASMLFLSTFACAAGSVAYLFKGSERGDWLGRHPEATRRLDGRGSGEFRAESRLGCREGARPHDPTGRSG